MNFVTDVVLRRDPQDLAVLERTRSGERRPHTFGELADRAGRLAGTLGRLGAHRGDVVLTLVGSRVEWVEVLLACFGTGRVVLPCTEQLRAADLRHRVAVARPALLVADERNRPVVQEADLDCPVLYLPDPAAYAAEPERWVELAATDPCLLTFTSGTSGRAKAVRHGQRYLAGQWLQALHWLGAQPGDLVWCTAATGWSKSARNAFVAPWLSGAAAFLHDARFDPAQRMALAAEEGVAVLCMAPTEYRVIAGRGALRPLPAVRSLVAAGEALDRETLARWHEVTGLFVRDGYGQSETGQVTANPLGADARPGSMGRPLPGVAVQLVDGELLVDPATVPTFFLGYLGEPAPTGWWHTGDRVRQEPDGYLYFEGRADDVINSAGYRIGPFEVEDVLAGHPAVAEAAVVGAPDAERGQVVRAVVVLRAGYLASPELVADLQQHVRERTAPYKYPRVVDFVTELPKTSTGKLRRTALRGG
ncbi:MAG TPA: AMP-binding protein [Mycobacteriales bacterium]|nr:AMP-binding protein [Mycobacteriales bacterium]